MAETLLLLAIETTCDETGAAVLEGPRPPRAGVPGIRSNVVASQIGPAREVRRVVPGSPAGPTAPDPPGDRRGVAPGGRVPGGPRPAVAVATRPAWSAPGDFGLTARQEPGLALGIPLGRRRITWKGTCTRASSPSRSGRSIGVGLFGGFSGGTPASTSAGGRSRRSCWAARSTTAAGEAFDKVASLLGLGYPRPRHRAAPPAGGTLRPMPSASLPWVTTGLVFSFSGLKTPSSTPCAGKMPGPGRGSLRLRTWSPTVARASRTPSSTSWSPKARQALRAPACDGWPRRRGRGQRPTPPTDRRDGRRGRSRIVFPPLTLCTDNAAMAASAFAKLAAGRRPTRTLTSPRLVRNFLPQRTQRSGEKK